VAQTRIETLRAERNDARRNALDEAIAPLLELAAPLRTGAQRDPLAAYVIRKLHNTWSTRQPATRISDPAATAHNLYLRHGYTDHGAPIRLPDGPPMYPMLRRPIGVTLAHGAAADGRDRDEGQFHG
jgi:hypothetical protein